VGGVGGRGERRRGRSGPAIVLLPVRNLTPRLQGGALVVQPLWDAVSVVMVGYIIRIFLCGLLSRDREWGRWGHGGRGGHLRVELFVNCVGMRTRVGGGRAAREWRRSTCRRGEDGCEYVEG
jgi:hypothetical protein